MIKIQTTNVLTELPVFTADLSFVKPQLDLARRAIDELRVTHPQSPDSNVKALYMSPWHSHLLNPKLGPITDSVVTIAQEVARSYLSANLAVLNMEMIVTDCWGVIYEKSDYTQAHHHFPSDLSCVIYLEASDDSAPIIFGGKLAIKPKTNLMVMFPGLLTHEVPATAAPRVVLAMNLNKRAVFKVPLTELQPTAISGTALEAPV